MQSCEGSSKPSTLKADYIVHIINNFASIVRFSAVSKKIMTFSLFSLILLTGFSRETARAAEFSIHPSIAVSEEYNDNVFDSRIDKKTDYITRVLPGIALKYNAPFWDWDIAYNYDYRYYARNSHDDDNTHNLLGKGLVRIIDDFLLLDVSDTYRRVSLDVSRDYTQESLVANQSDSNIVTASPYFVFRSGQKMTVKTGYRYSNVWYRDPAAIDKREHSGFIDATYDYSSKLSFNANYTFTHQNSINEYDKHAPFAGARYEYADRSFIFAQGGYTWIFYKNGFNTKNPYWNAGVNHTFGTFTAYFNTGVQYPEDPLSGLTRETDYTLGLNKNMERGNVGLSVYYSKYDEENSGRIIVDGTNSGRTKKYGAGITSKYDLTEKLGGTLAANVEKYDQKNTGSYTRRILVNPGLSYMLPKEISISLNYTFIDYYSPGIFSDNYQVNRVILEVNKTF